MIHRLNHQAIMLAGRVWPHACGKTTIV